MNKKYGILIICNAFLVLDSIGTASATIWTVDADGGADFTGIQDAVDTASVGDTLIVKSGTYYENVLVNKQLILKGVDSGGGKPVVGVGGGGIPFRLSADGITLDSFNTTSTGRQSAGIKVTSNDNTITNNTISNADYGITLSSCNNTLVGNTVSNNNDYGIYLSSSCSNKIIGNTISNNNDYGIYLHKNSNNTITGNSISNSNNGIYLYGYSNKNNISDNAFVNDGLFVSDSYQNTVDGNTVNGKPLVYLEDTSNTKVVDAGQVILVNCKNITVENLDLSNANVGVALWETEDSIISNNTVSNNSRDGIYFDSSHNNTISGNTVSNNDNGIYLWDSNNNTISGNNASNNKIHLNNFMNNTDNVYSYNSTNIWNSIEKIAYTYNSRQYTNYLGNYWSDYVFEGNDTNGDGIGDTPYNIYGDIDRYPLMVSWEKYFVPPENNFDTGPSENPYPCISGTHNGIITLNQTITVQTLYTYPCTGTGGHSEYAKICNDTWSIESQPWRGYQYDWHNLSFSDSFTLYASETYNYTIVTGSYPQIHHTDELEVASGTGTITCDKFVDASGKCYYDWIPAIRLDWRPSLF